MQSYKKMLRIGLLSCLLAGSFGVVLASLSYLRSGTDLASERDSYTATKLVGMLGSRPITVEFDPMAVNPPPCVREDLSRFVSVVSAPGPTENGVPSRSRKFHVGRLLAISGGIPEWIVDDKSMSVSHVRLGAEEFQLTWRGVEAVATPRGERSEHRDQTLATLAESNVRLDSTIDTQEGIFPVADLLATSISEFHLDQDEISWSASAYASYLPPQTVWWNRYGEKYSFDTLVKEMMNRKLNRESCQGLHMVMVLTKILKVDRKMAILAPEVRLALSAYLRCKLTEAVSSQLEDGSWPLLWSESGYHGVFEYTPVNDDLNRLLVTGHMLEWFHLLPTDIKPPSDVLRTGCLWLLSNLRTSSRDAINKNFCPYTHAVLSLYLACSGPLQ